MDMNNNLKIRVSPDNLQAELMLVKGTWENSLYTKEHIINCLKKHKITYGIKYDVIEKLMSEPCTKISSVLIAEGTNKIDGQNARINKVENVTAKKDKKDWDFRDVMDIPTVKKGDKLASITVETDGIDGTNVFGNNIKAHKGKSLHIKAGKHVIYNEDNASFFAEKEGQVSFTNKYIHVEDVYEVNETLSMKVGNIQFPGTVIIRGDVPTGFTIKADGDIKVFGIVEGATLKAVGSIYISEGIAGVQQASVEAGNNIYARYINQGSVSAGETITVDHSILHSDCKAGHSIHCRVGNIIGGNICAQMKIEAKDIGNRMHTKTTVGIVMESIHNDKKEQTEVTHLRENIVKIDTLIQRMEKSKSNLSGQDRVLLLRLKKSKQSTKEQLEQTELKITHERINQRIVTNGTIYPNVTVFFGKYETVIKKDVNFMTLLIDRNDIKYVPNVSYNYLHE